MALQFRRGTAAQLPSSGAAGEPLFVTDGGKLYIGTGSGRVLVAGGADGADGAPGSDGSDGREVELRTSQTHIQWRYVGDQAWQDLVALSTLEGPQGPAGTGINIEGSANNQSELPPSGEVGDAYLIGGNLFVWDGAAWVDAGNIQGPAGADGADGATGADGADGAPGADGVDGAPGADGREVQLQKSATHIQWKYADESTWTDLVALSEITGADGADGADGAPGADGADGADAQLPAATQGQTGYL